MDSIYDFIFTNPPLYNIHEFVFALIEFDGAWRLPRVSSGFPFKFRMCRYLVLPCTPQGDIDNK